jgi:hypothetical protein
MKPRIRRLLTVPVAAAAALAVWALAVPLGGVDLAVDQSGSRQTVGPVLVVAASLVAGAAAWALLAVLEKATARAGRIWTIIAAAVLAVSLLGPLGAVTTAATLVLMGMHVAVGAVLIAGLVRR